MSTAEAPRPLYLQTDELPPSFAFFQPGVGGTHDTAVLLCPPFGWDDMCSYRSRREWAERLAAAGHATLRLDLPGSGDSGGGPSDPGQLESWTRAVSGAAQWLLEASDARLLAAVGIGLGGMIACRAAMAGAPIDALALWAVPARGRTLVRELRAFSALEVAYVPDTDQDGAPAPQPPLEEGALVANGYLLSAETVAELERLDLTELAGATLRTRHALLLGREGLKGDSRLQAALEHAGAQVTLADGMGYGAMMVEPQDSRAPTAVFELVGSWLGEADAETKATRVASEKAQGTPLSGLGRTTAREHAELLHCGARLRETPMYVDGPDGSLFGILTEPEPPTPRGDLCAVLMNAGPQRRTGPNRMWVEIARRWAARGVPTLRFDLAGIGDSDGDAAALAQVASFYTPAYVAQARTAFDALGARGLPERFVVLGLCSGAYWSTHSALEDERIGTVIMLNPRSLIWDQWVYGVQRTRELRQRLLMASSWRKVLRGEITLARHLETVGALASRLRSAPRAIRERIRGSRPSSDGREESLTRIFDSLRDRGQSALMLFTGSEPLHLELMERGILGRPDRWPNLRVAILGTSADTHTLTPLWLQREVHELIDTALEEEISRLPSSARV